MPKIGIIICDRYKSCGGGKCFRALRARQGGFSVYAPDEAVEVVGFSSCGGCPGGNVESLPTEFLRNGCEVVHLATGLVVGYPPCPYLRQLKEYIERAHGLPVVVGTHPIPLHYLETHRRLTYWEASRMEELAGPLMSESREVMRSYD